MQPTALHAPLPPRAASQLPYATRSNPITLPTSPWAQTCQWAKDVTVETAARTFHWALIPPMLLESVAYEAVGQVSNLAAAGPAICGGVSFGVASWSIGQGFPEGFQVGSMLGGCTAHVLVETPYRLTMFGLIAGAAGTSIAVGAALGSIALAGGTARVASAKACAALHTSASAVLNAVNQALDAGDRRLGQNSVA